MNFNNGGRGGGYGPPSSGTYSGGSHGGSQAAHSGAATAYGQDGGPNGPISVLQNYARRAGTALPKMSVARVGGQDHEPVFRCTVDYTDERGTRLSVEANGTSKNGARRNACKVAMQRLDARTGFAAPGGFGVDRKPAGRGLQGSGAAFFRENVPNPVVANARQMGPSFKQEASFKQEPMTFPRGGPPPPPPATPGSGYPSHGSPPTHAGAPMGRHAPHASGHRSQTNARAHVPRFPAPPPRMGAQPSAHQRPQGIALPSTMNAPSAGPRAPASGMPGGGGPSAGRPPVTLFPSTEEPTPPRYPYGHAGGSGNSILRRYSDAGPARAPANRYADGGGPSTPHRGSHTRGRVTAGPADWQVYGRSGGGQGAYADEAPQPADRGGRTYFTEPDGRGRYGGQRPRSASYPDGYNGGPPTNMQRGGPPSATIPRGGPSASSTMQRNGPPPMGAPPSAMQRTGPPSTPTTQRGDPQYRRDGPPPTSGYRARPRSPPRSRPGPPMGVHGRSPAAHIDARNAGGYSAPGANIDSRSPVGYGPGGHIDPRSPVAYSGRPDSMRPPEHNAPYPGTGGGRPMDPAYQAGYPAQPEDVRPPERDLSYQARPTDLPYQGGSWPAGGQSQVGGRPMGGPPQQRGPETVVATGAGRPVRPPMDNPVPRPVMPRLRSAPAPVPGPVVREGDPPVPRRAAPVDPRLKHRAGRQNDAGNDGEDEQLTGPRKELELKDLPPVRRRPGLGSGMQSRLGQPATDPPLVPDAPRLTANMVRFKRTAKQTGKKGGLVDVQMENSRGQPVVRMQAQGNPVVEKVAVNENMAEKENDDEPLTPLAEAPGEDSATVEKSKESVGKDSEVAPGKINDKELAPAGNNDNDTELTPVKRIVNSETPSKRNGSAVTLAVSPGKENGPAGTPAKTVVTGVPAGKSVAPAKTAVPNKGTVLASLKNKDSIMADSVKYTETAGEVAKRRSAMKAIARKQVNSPTSSDRVVMETLGEVIGERNSAKQRSQARRLRIAQRDALKAKTGVGKKTIQKKDVSISKKPSPAKLSQGKGVVDAKLSSTPSPDNSHLENTDDEEEEGSSSLPWKMSMELSDDSIDPHDKEIDFDDEDQNETDKAPSSGHSGSEVQPRKRYSLRTRTKPATLEEESEQETESELETKPKSSVGGKPKAIGRTGAGRKNLEMGSEKESKRRTSSAKELVGEEKALDTSESQRQGSGASGGSSSDLPPAAPAEKTAKPAAMDTESDMKNNPASIDGDGKAVGEGPIDVKTHADGKALKKVNGKLATEPVPASETTGETKSTMQLKIDRYASLDVRLKTAAPEAFQLARKWGQVKRPADADGSSQALHSGDSRLLMPAKKRPRTQLTPTRVMLWIFCDAGEEQVPGLVQRATFAMPPELEMEVYVFGMAPINLMSSEKVTVFEIAPSTSEAGRSPQGTQVAMAHEAGRHVEKLEQFRRDSVAKGGSSVDLRLSRVVLLSSEPHFQALAGDDLDVVKVADLRTYMQKVHEQFRQAHAVASAKANAPGEADAGSGSGGTGEA